VSIANISQDVTKRKTHCNTYPKWRC